MSLWTLSGYSEVNVLLQCNVFTSFTRFPQFETLNELLHETD